MNEVKPVDANKNFSSSYSPSCQITTLRISGDNGNRMQKEEEEEEQKTMEDPVAVAVAVAVAVGESDSNSATAQAHVPEQPPAASASASFRHQPEPFWEDLEPFQPVTAKAYWRTSDLPSASTNSSSSSSSSSTPIKNHPPRAMWKRPLHPDPKAPENEWLPEMDVILQLTDIHMDSNDTYHYAKNGGPLHGIWATMTTTSSSSSSFLVDQYGNVPPANLILYPPGVPPPSNNDETIVVPRGKWSLPAGRKIEWPPLTDDAKLLVQTIFPEWQINQNSSWEPQTAKVFTKSRAASGSSQKYCTVGVWKFMNEKNNRISDSDLLPEILVEIRPLLSSFASKKYDQRQWEEASSGVWCTNPNSLANDDGQWQAEDIWFLPPHQTPPPGVLPRGKWTTIHQNESWPPLTEQAKRRRLGNLPQWPEVGKGEAVILPTTATVYSQLDPRRQDKAPNLQGTWKIVDSDSDSQSLFWDPQYVLVYPQQEQVLDATVPHGLWGVPMNATPNADGCWDAKNVWFLPPGTKNLDNFWCRGKWVYSPTKRNPTWPPPPSKHVFANLQTTENSKNVSEAASRNQKQRQEAPIQVPRKQDNNPSTRSIPGTERSTSSEDKVVPVPVTKKQDDDSSIDPAEPGFSRPNFLSPTKAAAAALRKKRAIEQRFSKHSNASSTTSAAFVKKPTLDRRYSSTSHKEMSEAIRKSREDRVRYSSNEILRLSENTKSMLEASSTLIASMVSSMPPSPIAESPSPVMANNRKESITVPKVHLVESLLAEEGTLVVLCKEIPETRTMGLDQDNALLLCYDVPKYSILYVENDLSLAQELLEISRKSIYPQFFYEPNVDSDSDSDNESGGGGADTKNKETETEKYVYLGGLATVRAMLIERMSFQYRIREQRERRKSSSRPIRAQSLNI
ncbi:unnamed protein product [Cylindrotheca closterium]|uniref:Uncharacterized protein n=1 Tax=Cylindrotheca closterium TaxID=2856 RepID=A0AAD2CKF2_9STRA|nr:unnamed protein product [Cylindrotheca closterium]